MGTPIVQKQEMKVIGIEVRTSNKEEMSGNCKIGPQWQKFFQENLGEKVPNQVHPEELMAIYMDYVSDVNGEYSFVLGKQVHTFDSVPEGMITKTLPASKYVIFTSRQGAMPDIVIELWQKIWGLKASDLGGGGRAYRADFELYDSRSQDPKKSQIDVYLSIK